MTKVQSCMDDKGWQITRIPENQGPGFNLGQVPEEQRSVQRSDLKECQGQAGPQPFTEMSKELAHTMYAEVVARGKCLSRLGYDIGQPPSEAKWVSQMMSGDPTDDPWDPYEDLPDVDSSTWSKVTDACPQGGIWGG